MLVGRVHWFFDLFSHFLVHVAAAVAVAVLLAALARAWLLFLGGLLTLAGCAIPIWPYLASPPAAVADASLRVLVFNVHTANRETDRFIDFVRASDPDLVALMEITPEWATALEVLHDEYPHRESTPRTDNFGIAVYSKLALGDPRVLSTAEVELPSVTARLVVGKKPVTLLVTHPPPPLGEAMARMQTRQLADLARQLGGRNSRLLVVGDLNATPWSSTYREFAQRSGLRNGRLGRGIQPTWPATYPWLGIPIDHVLVGVGLTVSRHQRGPDLGSDHLPIVADVGVLP